MNTMEFDDMKKIWDTQNNEALYAINESALHKRIQAKKRGTKRMTSMTEIILIAANLIAGGMVIISHLIKNSSNIPIFIMGGLMLTIGLYIGFLRHRRIQRDQQTDLSMLGDIDNAIKNINYRIWLSQSMVSFGLLVIGFTMFSVINSDKSLFTTILIGGFFVIGFALSLWEHKHFHVGKKRQLLALREKLVNDLEVS